jgi:hypothetical protein
MKITAAIHLLKRSRNANARYGKFVRPDKAPHPSLQDLHLWLGRELSIEEFNREFPAAVKCVLTTDQVFGTIIEREGEDDATKNDLEALKQEHEDKLAAIQSGVNAFTADANLQIAAANDQLATQAARIAELEKQLAEATKPAAEGSTPSPEVVDEAPSPTPPEPSDAPPAASQPTAKKSGGKKSK